MTMHHLGMPAVSALLADRIADLARELTGTEPTVRGRSEWRFRRRGSLAVVVSGPKRGAWHDHEAGEGGDALALVAHLRRCPMRDAHAWARAWLGLGGGASQLPPPSRLITPRLVHEAQTAVHGSAPADDRKAWSRRLAKSLWREGADARGTPVEAYLRFRGLALPDAPEVLCFHPRAWRNRANGPHGPAMLALMTDPATAAPVGVHVTYLRPDGAGKAPGHSPKIMLGDVGVVRLVPDAEVTLGLGLAEGIETALSVMQGFGWRPVWAATCAGAIARFPVLAGLEALTVFADADDRGGGLRAARACAKRWSEAGREARVLAAPAGEDFHDTLRRTAA